MPTYAQLQSESWWGREVETPELRWFGDELCRALGVGRNHFGTKGDNAHLNGGHRSQEWLKNSRWCTNRSYTTMTGLSADQMRHIAAFDITPATREQMLTISRNLDKVTRAGLLEEVVEWYGNTNNDQRVDGWNNIRNAVASSDSSHLWHVHGTFDRRVLRDRSVMQRTLNALLHGTGSAASTTPTQGDVDVTPEELWSIVRAVQGGKSFWGFQAAAAPAWARDTADYNNAAVEQRLAAKLDALAAKPSGSVALTDADRDAIVAGLVSGLAGNTTFLGAVAKAVADEQHKRQKD